MKKFELAKIVIKGEKYLPLPAVLQEHRLSNDSIVTYEVELKQFEKVATFFIFSFQSSNLPKVEGVTNVCSFENVNDQYTSKEDNYAYRRLSTICLCMLFYRIYALEHIIFAVLRDYVICFIT